MSGETCALCARVADPEGDGDPPLGWTSDASSGPDELRWICPQCTRRFVRSIEAKLDQDWW